ncbi:hypothetical protein HYT52_00775 [Candidatus Woesearchaeota archaeon]|nr:hypothetical protein [Candidatus Woesearchaeota archaeon]
MVYIDNGTIILPQKIEGVVLENSMGIDRWKRYGEGEFILGTGTSATLIHDLAGRPEIQLGIRNGRWIPEMRLAIPNERYHPRNPHRGELETALDMISFSSGLVRIDTEPLRVSTYTYDPIWGFEALPGQLHLLKAYFSEGKRLHGLPTIEAGMEARIKRIGKTPSDTFYQIEIDHPSNLDHGEPKYTYVIQIKDVEDTRKLDQDLETISNANNTTSVLTGSAKKPVINFVEKK